MAKKKHTELSITETSDFQYVLELIPLVLDDPSYSWLPELFATIGHESLIKLCKYAGGEQITIPTLEDLSRCVNALDWYYKIHIKHECDILKAPMYLRPEIVKIAKTISSRM